MTKDSVRKNTKSSPKKTTEVVQHEEHDPQQTIKDIETKISTGYKIYSALVVLNLIFAVVKLALSLADQDSEVMDKSTQVVYAFLFIVACALTLVARSSYHAEKQFMSFGLFLVVTIIEFLHFVYIPDEIQSLKNSGKALVIGTRSVWCLVQIWITYNSHTLRKLMDERDDLMDAVQAEKEAKKED